MANTGVTGLEQGLQVGFEQGGAGSLGEQTCRPLLEAKVLYTECVCVCMFGAVSWLEWAAVLL